MNVFYKFSQNKYEAIKMKKFLLYLSLIVLILLSGFNLALIVSPEIRISHPLEEKIYNAQEELIYSKVHGEFGTYVPLEKIADSLKETIIAIEDREFYSHKGINLKRIVSSMFSNIQSGEIVAGGSTITQQLARTLFLDNSKTYDRKLKEIFLAKKIERSYSKDKILELYLNCVYFGHNLYGIDSAAHFYFNKNPLELSYGESAGLVGIINAPGIYSPFIDLEAFKEKQKNILYTLYELNIINVKQYYEELSKPLNFLFQKREVENDQLLYYQDGIEIELQQLGYDSEYYQYLGLNISTYLDLDIERKISQIIEEENIDTSKQEIAIVVMEPNSGKVLTLIGGENYIESPFNRALSSRRQIGSTVKPLLYYLGLENGMTPLSLMRSEPVEFFIKGIGKYAPTNANDVYANADITMIEALGMSDNIYATKTTLLVGSSTLASLIKSFGIEVSDVNPTIGLGSNVMSPLELTAIYNCFASEGVFYKPSFIKTITLSNGRNLYSNNKTGKRLLSKNETIIMNYMMRAPFDRGLISYASPSLVNFQTTHRFSAKTGSTESTNWTIGFNPLYTIGVYVGTDTNESLQDTKLARRLFQKIANKLMEDKEDIFFDTPSSLKAFHLKNKYNSRLSFTYYSK